MKEFSVFIYSFCILHFVLDTVAIIRSQKQVTEILQW